MKFVLTCSVVEGATRVHDKSEGRNGLVDARGESETMQESVVGSGERVPKGSVSHKPFWKRFLHGTVSPKPLF